MAVRGSRACPRTRRRRANGSGGCNWQTDDPDSRGDGIWHRPSSYIQTPPVMPPAPGQSAETETGKLQMTCSGARECEGCEGVFCEGCESTVCASTSPGASRGSRGQHFGLWRVDRWIYVCSLVHPCRQYARRNTAPPSSSRRQRGSTRTPSRHLWYVSLPPSPRGQLVDRLTASADVLLPRLLPLPPLPRLLNTPSHSLTAIYREKRVARSRCSAREGFWTQRTRGCDAGRTARVEMPVARPRTPFERAHFGLSNRHTPIARRSTLPRSPNGRSIICTPSYCRRTPELPSSSTKNTGQPAERQFFNFIQRSGRSRLGCLSAPERTLCVNRDALAIAARTDPSREAEDLSAGRAASTIAQTTGPRRAGSGTRDPARSPTRRAWGTSSACSSYRATNHATTPNDKIR